VDIAVMDNEHALVLVKLIDKQLVQLARLPGLKHFLQHHRPDKHR